MSIAQGEQQQLSCFVDRVDGDEGNSTHMLLSKWTLWFDAPSQQRQSEKDWTSNMSEVFSFDTVEDFWRLFNNVKAPSGLVFSSNYHLFRHGVKPAWEDPMNEHGGRWRFELKGNPAEFDNCWRLLTAAIVGEHFDFSEHVCGVVGNPRKNFQRMSIWLKNAHDEKAVQAVGRALKEACKSNASWDFEGHHKNALTFKL